MELPDPDDAAALGLLLVELVFDFVDEAEEVLEADVPDAAGAAPLVCDKVLVLLCVVDFVVAELNELL